MRGAFCFRALESSRDAVVNCSSRVILGAVKRLHWDQWKVLEIDVPFVLELSAAEHLQWSIDGPTSHPNGHVEPMIDDCLGDREL